MKINENLSKLINENSFYKATELIKKYKIEHPNNDIVSLGIGDVSFPIPKYVAKKMKDAVKTESSDGFVGYGNYFGIPSLRKAIRENEYPSFSEDEIYISQGTKSDCTDILELVAKDALIAIPNPTYPIYENSCITLNRKYELISCDNRFVPVVPKKHYDVVFLCSPNNPVGISYTKDELKKWVDYANKENCLIIFDNVYFKFIQNGVKSIYEIDGARKCAIELRSFSKHVSFTGLRCSYYVIPNELHNEINKLWRLRTINRFNGASYVSQVGALASFDKKCQAKIIENVKNYQENAGILLKTFTELGYEVSGGIDAPYLWIKTKNELGSWEMFDLFLNKLEVIIVPGIIFGSEGDKYFRVSALGKRSDILKAVERIKKYEETK